LSPSITQSLTKAIVSLKFSWTAVLNWGRRMTSLMIEQPSSDRRNAMPEDCSFTTLRHIDQARGGTYTIQDDLDLGAEGLRSP
jgi:hypothetical protein